MMDNVVPLTPERTRIIDRLGDLTMAQSSVPLKTLVRITGVAEEDLSDLYNTSKSDLWKSMTLYACRVTGMRQITAQDDKQLSATLQKSFTTIVQIFADDLGTESGVDSFRSLLKNVDDLLAEDYPSTIDYLTEFRLDIPYVEKYLRATIIYGFMRDPNVRCLIQEFFTHALGRKDAEVLVQRLGEYRG